MAFPQIRLDAAFNVAYRRTYERELTALRAQAQAELEESPGYEQDGGDDTIMSFTWGLYFEKLEDAPAIAHERALAAANVAEMEEMLSIAGGSHQ